MPSARFRRWPSPKEGVRIERAAGAANAAVTPFTKRATISSGPPVAIVPGEAFSEGGREDRERGWRRERSRHAFDEAGDDQQRPMGCDGAEEGRGDQGDQPPHEAPLPAEDVGAPAAEEQEPAVAEDERGD